jgi:hypothetical protein
MSDEVMAKKLGWKKLRSLASGECLWTAPEADGRQTTGKPPAFTKSLDAIVAEIEARQLDWSLIKDNDHLDIMATVGTPLGHTNYDGFDTPAPLALCHALCAYLSDTQTKKPGGE